MYCTIYLAGFGKFINMILTIVNITDTINTGKHQQDMSPTCILNNFRN